MKKKKILAIFGTLAVIAAACFIGWLLLPVGKYKDTAFDIAVLAAILMAAFGFGLRRGR